MEIIPAIDLINGQCVRLTKGDYKQVKVYHKNPLEMAKQFEGAGVQRLHLVDLEGAKGTSSVHLKVLEDIATNTRLKIDFGGGIKSKEAVKQALNAGAGWVTLGSFAVSSPEGVAEIVSELDATRLILGADILGGKIATHGWLKTSSWSLADFLNHYEQLGLTQLISTAVEQDGMMMGPDYELYRQLKDMGNWNIIASGGVSKLEDLYRLKEMQLKGVIVGKAFYEGKINLTDIQQWNQAD